MEAHEAMERVDRMHGGEHGGGHDRGRMASVAAVVVAVLAAFLAVATFLSNEQVKDVITSQTRASETGGQLEANAVKIDVADGNSTLLRVVGDTSPKADEAAAKALTLQRRIDTELKPRDAALQAKVTADTTEVTHSDNKHTLYEISEVGLQVGIVLAGIAILIRRRWLLAFGGVMGLAGIAVLFAGVAY